MPMHIPPHQHGVDLHGFVFVKTAVCGCDPTGRELRVKVGLRTGKSPDRVTDLALHFLEAGQSILGDGLNPVCDRPALPAFRLGHELGPLKEPVDRRRLHPIEHPWPSTLFPSALGRPTNLTAPWEAEPSSADDHPTLHSP